MTDQLTQLRDRIDAIDEQLQTLINERAACAKQVGHIKQQQALTEAGVPTLDQADPDVLEDKFYRPEREAQVLRRVIERNQNMQGHLSDETMVRFFREIMSACLALEKPLRIAYLGPTGTYTQAAALKHFGSAITALPMTSIDAVFLDVERQAVDFGVVPVENSTEGVVSYTLDRLMNSSLLICGEVQLRINHHLLHQSGDAKQIKTIVGHQQALAQCRQWLNDHFPQVETQAVSSNAKAAELAVDNPHMAAIASAAAAEIYQLHVIADHIEDKPDNTTRFLIIGRHPVPPSGQDKTSIMLAAKNKPGALAALLKPLGDNEQMMTRIESRPSGQQAWEYLFFIDVEGHQEDRALARALRALEQEAAVMRILGSYPRFLLA